MAYVVQAIPVVKNLAEDQTPCFYFHNAEGMGAHSVASEDMLNKLSWVDAFVVELVQIEEDNSMVALIDDIGRDPMALRSQPQPQMEVEPCGQTCNVPCQLKLK